MFTKLPEVPVITPEGKKIYARRCGTCANLRSCLIKRTVNVRIPDRQIYRQVHFYEVKDTCNAPPETRMVDLGVTEPPTGRRVERKNYCGFWRSRRYLYQD